MKRLLAAFLAAVLAFLLPGCWSRMEISELAIIVAAGFDYEEGPEPYRITMQIARVSALVRGGAAQGTGKGEPVEVVTGTGRTPHEAGRALQRGMPRRFHPQHNEVWIIGEEMARKGIGPLIDFFERLHLLRPNMLVLMAHGDAREVLQRSENLERTLAETLTGLMRFRTYTASTMRVTVNDLTVALSRPGRQPVVPGVRLETATIDKGKPMVMLDALAVFKEDRLVGWLPMTANLGFLWTVNQVARGVINIPCPDEEDRHISLDVGRGRSERRVEFVRGRPVLSIHTVMETDITAQECTKNLITPEGFDKLAKLQEKFVIDAIRLAVAEAQAYKADVLGLGEVVYRTAPAYWRRVAPRWDDEFFPDLDVRVTAEVRSRRPGMSTGPVHKKHESEEER